MDPRIYSGKILIITGSLILIAGMVILFGWKIPFIGKLPGDINMHGRNWSFHFPVVSMILLSILLTIFLNIFFKR